MKIIRDNYILSLVAAVLLFYFSRPYFVWDVVDNNYVDFFASALLALCFFVNRNIRGKEMLLFLFLLGLVLFFAYKANANFWGVVSLSLVAFTPFARKVFYAKTFEYFTTIYAVISLISMIVLILVLVGVVTSPTIVEAVDDTNAVGFYSIYPMLVTQPLVFRFYGVYDEPGVVGTISAILLVCNQLNLKNWKSIIILIAGIISMSLFFYLIVASLLLLKLFYERKRGKYGVILIIILFSLFYVTTSSNDIMQETLWSRFAWDSDTEFFAGENRMHGKDEYFDSIIGTSEFWFGVNNREMYLQSVEGSSSYKNVIALNGFIFFVFYVLFFLMVGLKYKTNWFSFILYCLIVFTTIYQRPNTFSFLWLFLFVCVVKNSYGAITDTTRQSSANEVVIVS